MAYLSIRGETKPLSQAVPVRVDHLGGGVLRDMAGSMLKVVASELWYLDVIDCPDVVSLDLSSCHPNCHVTLRGCPALQYLHVPYEGSGAVIHLDSGNDVPILHVKGLVDHFDACWSTGQCSVSAKGIPWLGLWVNRHLESLSRSHPAFEAQCWVMLAPEVSYLEIDAPQLCHCFVSSGRELQALSVVAMSSESPQIEVQALPELLSVDIHSPAASCHLRDCRSLTLLSGAVTDLHLTHVAHRTDTLQIDMASERLILSHSGLEALVLKEPTELSLLHCPSLDRVSLPPLTTVQCEGPVPPSLLGIATVVVDEATVKSLISAYPRNPERVMRKLAKLIPSMSPSRACVGALKLLQQLSDQGAPLEQLWKIRLELSQRHLASRIKRRGDSTSQTAIALNHWKWQLPDDLCLEGWKADYQLWVRCAPVIPEAFHYRHTMVQACTQQPEGLAMQTVIHAMARHSELTHADELDLWCGVMEVMAAKESLSVANWGRQARLLSTSYGRAQRLDRAYLTACEKFLSLQELLDVLQRIGCHYVEVRVLLLSIAQRSAKWREERCDSPRNADHNRAQAMALAFSQVGLN